MSPGTQVINTIRLSDAVGRISQTQGYNDYETVGYTTTYTNNHRTFRDEQIENYNCWPSCCTDPNEFIRTPTFEPPKKWNIPFRLMFFRPGSIPYHTNMFRPETSMVGMIRKTTAPRYRE